MALGSRKNDRKEKLSGSLGSKKKGTTRYHSDRQERATAARISGEVQRGSGATENHKGDVVTDDWMIENKTTMHASISVKGEWLSKLQRESDIAGKTPALEVEIRGIEDLVTEKQWVLIPASVFAKFVTG